MSATPPQLRGNKTGVLFYCAKLTPRKTRTKPPFLFFFSEAQKEWSVNKNNSFKRYEA